ncbi:hypothetical protein [Fibrisoma montanum]|nr:hypothetical protein [Fibrisoma montanum]
MNSSIKDNPSFQKFGKDLEGLELFHKLYKITSIFGLKSKQMDELFKKLPELRQQYEDIIYTPDKFNKYFLSRGWVAYETMNLETMKTTVRLAEQGKVAEAEELLIEYNAPKCIEGKINMLWGVPAFRSRFELVQKAFEDYKESRYYTCIPIILSVIDVAVNDIEGKGFFADGTNLIAWDSIAAHSSGLSELAKLLGQTRKKTNTDPIDIPYRNGILHGRDLAYDNKIVAAKTWATLFAVRDWAQSVRDGKKVPPVEEIPKSLRQNLREIKQSLEQIAEGKKEQVIINQWKRRIVTIGVDIPRSGNVIDYADKSPEKEICQLIDNWRFKKYHEIARQLLHYNKASFHLKKASGKMRQIFGDSEPEALAFKEIIDEAPAITELVVVIEYSKSFQKFSKEVKFRLVYTDDDYIPVVRGAERGSWKIVENFWFLKDS